MQYSVQQMHGPEAETAICILTRPAHEVWLRGKEEDLLLPDWLRQLLAHMLMTAWWGEVITVRPRYPRERN